MVEPAGRGAEEIDRRLREHLSGRADVAFAYLYGSRAKGTADEESDVDVAVHFGADTHREADERAGSAGRDGTIGRRKAALQLEGALERELGRPVQVVVLEDAPPGLAHNVLDTGRLVVNRDDGTRRRFFVDHCRRYFDTEHIRRIFDRYRQRRIEEGAFGGGERDGP